MHISRPDTPITQAIRIVATAHFFQRRCKITTYFINYQTFSRLSEYFFESLTQRPRERKGIVGALSLVTLKVFEEKFGGMDYLQ